MYTKIWPPIPTVKVAIRTNHILFVLPIALSKVIVCIELNSAFSLVSPNLYISSSAQDTNERQRKKMDEFLRNNK